MTDCDLDPGLVLLRDAVYGGPFLPAALLAASLRRLGLAAPFQVVAAQPATVQAVPLPRSAAGRRIRVLRLHAGLEYWCCPGDVGEVLVHLDGLKVLHGTPQACAGAGGLLVAIREAVVAMRRVELAPLLAAPPDLGEEPRLRTAIIQHIAAETAWQAALARWLPVITVRHLRSLNNLRRKLIELYTQITRAHEERDLAFTFAAGVQRIMACHTYSGLVALYPEVLAAMVERLAKVRSAVGDLSRARSAAVKAAAAFARDRFRDPISLEDAAAAAGVSGAHLARAWRKEIGCSVGDALRQLRMTEAKRLLADGRRTVLDVALHCGFGSVEHFHRIFRAHHGSSPDAWRRSIGEDTASA